MTSTNAGRKRVNAKTYTADDQALGQIAREAEAKLAAKRAARNEAREIRMRELEKQQKENEEKQDRLYELTNDIPKASMRQFGGGGSSRRGSEDSTTDEGSREVRSQLAELDEKYKKAMMGTAQLHNEKQSLVYEVELLKDQLEEREEEVIESQREFRDKCKELESKKRSYRDLDIEFKNLKIQIEQRDKLIEENGLAIIISDEGEWTLVKASAPNGPLSAGLPTMGMVNSRLASEMDPSLAWDEDYKQNKCTQTDTYRVAPIVGRRPKATQTDEPDPATFRKTVDTTTIEIQTDDVPELLRAAIVYTEQITQTQSKPLEISEDEKYCQLIEYYRDFAVQTVESKFAPWTASHTIEELPPKPKIPPQPRTPTPPPVETEPEDDEIEKLRVEMDEDPIFDPSRFRKRMSLVETSKPSKEPGKKANKKEVERMVETKPSLEPPLAPVAVPEVQRQESIGIDQIVEIVDEPVFDPSRYKKRLSGLEKTEPSPASESTPIVSQPPPPGVQRQESVGFDQIFDDVEEPVFDPSRYKKRFSAVPTEETQAQLATEPKPMVSKPAPPPPEVKRQESVGFDQIFDNEEEPLFDPSRYLKRFSAVAQSPEQPQQPSPSGRDKSPYEAPVMDPSSLVIEPSSVSSRVEGSDKTNTNLQPSSNSNAKSDQVSVASQTPESHSQSGQEQLRTFCSQLTQTDDDYSVPEPGTNLSIPPPCVPEPEMNVEVLRRASSDSTVYDSPLSLNGSAVDLHNEDRMSRGRSSIDSTTIDINNKRYESNRDLASISRKNSALTNGQRSILSREGSPKLSSFSSRANSLRSIYSPEPVTQNHTFSSRETSVEPRSEGPTSILDENQLLKAELKKLNDQLEEERSKKKNSDDNQIFTANGPEMQLYEIQREASKQIHEYKLKLQKAEQDIATLEGSVNRLDTQVKRYRTEAEDSEKLEDELKQEKRKLMRELREAQSQIEELRNHNSHLQKRLEKMKQSRSALVK